MIPKVTVRTVRTDTLNTMSETCKNLMIEVRFDLILRVFLCRYSSSMKTLSNKFMHLTNYSVNKKNSEYQTNSDDKACQGHKW